MTLNTVAISGSQGCAGAVYVSDAAEVGGEHVRIGGVVLPGDDYGVPVEGLDSVDGEPVVLTGNRMFGVYARGTAVFAGTDTFVGIYDLVVRNTSVNGNEAEECGANNASSLAAFRGADMIINEFTLDASALAGVSIGNSGSTIKLSNGTVSNNPIALNIQDPDYDLATLQDKVDYPDNGVFLDSEKTAVPQPEADLDSF